MRVVDQAFLRWLRFGALEPGLAEADVINWPVRAAVGRLSSMVPDWVRWNRTESSNSAVFGKFTQKGPLS